MDPQEKWYDISGLAESPAHHRYPVWWTGDWVDLSVSVATLVDAGVHALKPFVHSDCGGNNGRHKTDHALPGASRDMVRWAAHCAFGAVTRFHGDDHRPFSYDEHTETAIRGYLQTRYRLLPSLLAAARTAGSTGHPLAARGDLLWPEHSPESERNDQYIFLDDLLVAPLPTLCPERSPDDCMGTTAGAANYSTRAVWLPPGEWEDAWSGEIETGPRLVDVTARYDRMPLWIRRDGGLFVIADEGDKDPALRVAEQDWNTLTVEAFPAQASTQTKTHTKTHRQIYERGSSDNRTDLTLSRRDGTVRLSISGGGGCPRAWVARLHLRPGESVVSAAVDGKAAAVEHLEPEKPTTDDDAFPLRGAGTHPPPNAGPVAEIRIDAGVSKTCVLEARMSGS